MKNTYINKIIPSLFKEDMRKYFEKTIDFVIELEDGSLVAFDKPTIETSFCFPFDERQDETITKANKAAEDCKNKAYFIRENLKQLDVIEEDSRVVKYFQYGEEGGVVGFTIYNGSSGYLDMYLNKPDYYIDASASDIKKIKEGLALQKINFTKRLETYWKRYGASKFRTWTYSIND